MIFYFTDTFPRRPGDVGLALNECYYILETEMRSHFPREGVSERAARDFRNVAAADKVKNVEGQIDEVMARGKRVFDEFYGESLLFMDNIVRSVAQETSYKVNDVVENNTLFVRRFVREKSKQ